MKIVRILLMVVLAASFTTTVLAQRNVLSLVVYVDAEEVE